MAGVAALWHKLPPHFHEQVNELKGHVAEFHFDDGYEDIMRAGDVLERRGLFGVFFIVPGWLGLDGQATKANVLELHMRGHTIANHTMHHVWMQKVPVPVQHAEWELANVALTDITGVRPDRYAWPYGLHGNVTLGGMRPRGIDPKEVFAPRDLSARGVQNALRVIA